MCFLYSWVSRGTLPPQVPLFTRYGTSPAILLPHPDIKKFMTFMAAFRYLCNIFSRQRSPHSQGALCMHRITYAKKFISIYQAPFFLAVTAAIGG